MSDPDNTANTRVILDPSFLFEPDAIDWLEDPELQSLFVISAGLVDRLVSDEFEDEWRQ